MKLLKIYLNKEHKKRFLEMLLIVGSILAALNPNGVVLVIFLMFIIVSIAYYATLFISTKEKKGFKFVPFFISVTFSGTVVGLFGQSLKQLTSQYLIIIFYWLALTFLVYRILGSENI